MSVTCVKIDTKPAFSIFLKAVCVVLIRVVSPALFSWVACKAEVSVNTWFSFLGCMGWAWDSAEHEEGEPMASRSCCVNTTYPYCLPSCKKIQGSTHPWSADWWRGQYSLTYNWIQSNDGPVEPLLSKLQHFSCWHAGSQAKSFLWI